MFKGLPHPLIILSDCRLTRKIFGILSVDAVDEITNTRSIVGNLMGKGIGCSGKTHKSCSTHIDVLLQGVSCSTRPLAFDQVRLFVLDSILPYWFTSML